MIHIASLRQLLLRRVGNSWVLRHWGPRLLPRLDRQVHHWTNGRWMPSRLLAPVLILHTIRRDGTPCRTPLLTGRTATGDYIVMATNFGRTRHPAWSYHLLHNPYAAIDWHGRTLPVQAHRLSPQEQQAARPHILTWMPCFDDYAHRSQRDVRVFTLTPLPRTADASKPTSSPWTT
ncbi:nitroreductase family deazaflavin-dependent oxidoreductase [Streptomyces sp. D2-8]|uniref:nitroreductase/quinone reductase family protein n=1 Tax=Streptomyces sp. D2-8 TaxID=2707767 RepID=UPI0020BFF1A8|nr:nitroreductase/quinone reductase family protein [Streptomyces sp. D2-8]MCK8438457.1 nitroreductase family deazaflavin-dependent oxidoreductase [Streptomyces sp. D2-8]